MALYKIIAADENDKFFTSHVQQALALRRIVFRTDHVQDGHDLGRGVVHFIACLKGKSDEAVGTVRLRPLTQGVVLLEHLCVRLDHQRKKVGTDLVEKCNRYAADMLARHTIKINTPVNLVRFFEDCSYQKDGPCRQEGLNHIQPMSKSLTTV